MASYNKVILMGNLVARPEMRFSRAGKPMANFTLAVNESYRTATGEDQESVSFIDVTCFGKQAEVLTQYMDKGSPLLVDGRLRQERWQGKDGKNRSKIGVTLRRFQFLPRRNAGGFTPEAQAA